MKKVLLALFVLVILLCSNFADAKVIPITHIGTAHNDYIWLLGGASYIGEADRFGVATGFSLDQAYHVSFVTGFMNAIYAPENNPANISFVLDKGSFFRNGDGPLPSGNIVYRSEKFIVPYDGNTHAYSRPINMDLEAGEYWLEYQGGGQTPISRGSFQLEGEITTPEPATMFLLGGGLVGMMWRRRKFSRN